MNLKPDGNKVYMLLAGVFYIYFLYANVKGKRFTGSDTQKWEATGQNQQHHK